MAAARGGTKTKVEPAAETLIRASGDEEGGSDSLQAGYTRPDPCRPAKSKVAPAIRQRAAVKVAHSTEYWEVHN